MLASALVHVVAPEAHHVLGRRGQGPSGELLADDEADRDAQRRFRLCRHGIEVGLLAERLQRRFEVLRNPLHAHGADGGDARILHPLEHLLSGPRLRRVLPMHALVVVAQLQGELVADAADGVEFRFGAAHARQRHVDVVAARRRIALAEGNVELVVLGQRAHGGGGRALVRFDGQVVVAHGWIMPCVLFESLRTSG